MMYSVQSAPQRRPPRASPHLAQRQSPQSQQPDINRDSNALRASVLDAALALGIGSSRVVENWMFNAVDEEDEEEEPHSASAIDSVRSPGLTSGSTATSDESVPSPALDGALRRSPSTTAIRSVPPSPTKVFPIPPPPTPKHNKLRKKQREDGYISDGGNKSSSKSDKKSKKAGKAKDKESRDESSDEGGGYFSDFGRRRKTKKKEKIPALPQHDVGEESDGGYLSEASKKKRGFFRLKSKSSKSSGLAASAPPTPIPPPLPVPSPLPTLPIAERFVRTPEPLMSAPLEAHSYADVERSRSATPLARPELRTKPSVDSVSTADEPEIQTPATSLSGHGHMQSASEGYETRPSANQPKKGVRFTPSTRFSGPATAILDSQRQPVPPSPLDGSRPPALMISSPPSLVGFRPQPVPSPTPSDFTVVSASDFIEPSSNFIVPSPIERHAISIDLPAPSPSHLRVNVPSPSRSRFSLADLPPATPPPTGPLPDVPGGATVLAPSPLSASTAPPAFRFPPSTPSTPGAPPRAPSRNGSFTSIQQIARGRESPFPARPVLPAEESSDLVRRTSTRRRGVPVVSVDDYDEDDGRDDESYDYYHAPQYPSSPLQRLSPSPVTTPILQSTAPLRPTAGRSRVVVQEHAPPSPSVSARTVRDISPGVTYDPRDRARAHAPQVVTRADKDDDIRSDVALFFFPPGKTAAEQDTLSPYHSRIAPESVYEDDDRSVYAKTASIYAPSSTSRVDSYYFGDDADEESRPVSFVDDQRSAEMRARLMQRVGALTREEIIPPVPALPKGILRGAGGVGPAF